MIEINGGGIAIEKDMNVQHLPHDTLSQRWRRYTIRALIISQALILVAIALYVGGVATYFANFNFGSGGNTQGAAMIVGAIGLSICAVIGVFLSVLISLIALWHSGSPAWPALAILLPSLEAAVFVLVILVM